jgi:hypothetical protein
VKNIAFEIKRAISRIGDVEQDPKRKKSKAPKIEKKVEGLNIKPIFTPEGEFISKMH